MTDRVGNTLEAEEFIAAFENCTLSADSFDHRNHVRLTWLYIHRYPALEALRKVSDGLKRFAASVGKAQRYHETITFALFFLINERIARGPINGDWEEFAATNADLLDWKESILKGYYAAETLSSDLARRVFILPDKPNDLFKN